MFPLLTFTVILFIILQFEGFLSYEKLHWDYYDTTKNCQNELTNNWNVVGGGAFPNYLCQKSCTLGGSTYPTFSLTASSYPNGFEISKTLTQPASVVGIDIVFYVSGQFSMSLLSDNTLLDSQTLQNTPYDTFPQEIIYNGLTCSGASLKSIFKSVYKTIPSPSTKFRVQFKNLPSIYGFVKIYMWSNCVLNCSTCASESSCTTCIQGFRLIKMPSGQQVCSQQTGCSKTYCQECAISGSIEICVNCLPGYQLNGSNVCVQFGSSCSAGQYRHTDNSCYSYSSSCKMQPAGLTSWTSCYQTPDQTAVKCPSDKLILLYERGNYNTRACSCGNTANCESCNSSSCTKCLPGYTLSGSTCNFSSCPVGKVYNTLTKRCDPSTCPGTFCSKCDEFLCYQCTSSSYYVDGTNPINCNLCTVTNCDKCNPDGKCGQCKPGYFIDALGNCSSCADNCLQCNDPVICNTCVANYILSADQKSCLCSIPDCKQCDPNDGAICSVCNHGSFNSPTKTCTCLVPNCQFCNENTNSSCLQCNGYYIKDNLNQCQCTIQNCQTCNANGDLCNTCLTGYSKSTDSKICNCSVQYCSQCNPSNGSLCQQCVQGFDIQGGGATCAMRVQNCSQVDPTNGEKCIQCQTGYIQENYICKCGVANCLTCNALDGAKCDTCQTNYISINNQSLCSCAVSNCKTCNINDGSVCDSCQSGYTPLNGNTICQCSVSNCNQCEPTNGAQCQTCVSGYTPNNGLCLCSVDNCQNCNTLNGQKCDTCVNGYLSQSNQTVCQCSVQYCTKCVDNDGTQCQTCMQGFSPNQNNTQCICTIPNCSVCDTVNVGQCLTCNNGYDKSADGKTCNCHVANCQTCDINDGSKCTTCVTNYTQQDSSTCSCNVQDCSKCQQNDGKKCQLCDGGFSLSSDSLKCSCSIANCSLCDKINIGQCSQCIQGYLLQNSSTKCNCAVANCSQCNTFDGTQCTTCNKGYFKNNQGQCERICEILACDSCNPADFSQCLKCKSGYYPIQDNHYCQVDNVNTFQVDQSFLDDGYQIQVSFIQKVLVKNDLKEIIQANIINYEEVKDYIIIEITQIEENKINISVSMKKNCKGQKMVVSIKDQSFIQTNNLEKESEEIELKDFVKLSEEQKREAEQTKAVTENIKTTLLTTMLPIAILGNFYVLFNTIDLTTFIYYLLYVKVRYPSNVINFCSVFKNFQFAFIPNFWQVYVLDGYVQNSTPETFILNGSDAYFLNGAGQSMSIIVGIITIYFILKMLAYQEFYKPLKVYVQSKIESGWEFCAFFDLIWTVYMYVTVSSFLQFYSFDFTDRYSFINYTTWTLLLLAVFIIPLWITIFITQSKDLTDSKVQIQYASIIGGLKVSPPINVVQVHNFKQKDSSDENLKLSEKIKSFHQDEIIQEVGNNGYENLNKEQKDSPTNKNNETQLKENKQLSLREQRMYQWSKYANVLLYYRKILYALFIISFADMPYIQLTTISILNSMLAFYYFYIKPHERALDNIRNGAGEVILILMQITVFALIEDKEDQAEQDRINIGWAFIACASLILTMHIFSVVIDLLRGIFISIKDFIAVAYKFKKDYYLKRKLQQQEREKQLQAQKVIGKILPITKLLRLKSIKQSMNKLNLEQSMMMNKTNAQSHQPDSSFLSKNKDMDFHKIESSQQIIKTPDPPKSLLGVSSQQLRNESELNL